jgi:hypothetical protein
VKISGEATQPSLFSLSSVFIPILPGDYHGLKARKRWVVPNLFFPSPLPFLRMDTKSKSYSFQHFLNSAQIAEAIATKVAIASCLK